MSGIVAGPRRDAALDQRFDLRHAEARGDARRAAAAGADADLDGVDAALDRGSARLRRLPTLPADQLEVAEARAERLDGLRHHHRMAVRDVDDDHVDARADQLGGAFEIVALGADRRADEQAARARRAWQTAAAPGGRCPWP